MSGLQGVNKTKRQSIRDIIYKFILNTWSGKMTLEERETHNPKDATEETPNQSTEKELDLNIGKFLLKHTFLTKMQSSTWPLRL